MIEDGRVFWEVDERENSICLVFDQDVQYIICKNMDENFVSIIFSFKEKREYAKSRKNVMGIVSKKSISRKSTLKYYISRSCWMKITKLLSLW